MDELLMAQPRTLAEMVLRQARRRPEAAAILGLGRRALTYGELGAHLDATLHAVRSFGIGRGLGRL